MTEFNPAWLDPETADRKPLQKKVEGYIAVQSGEAKLMHIDAIQSAGLEKTDGKTWELFNAAFTLEIDGKQYYYGGFVEGLGFFNVMVAADLARELTEAERKYWSGAKMVMIGSHSRKVSYEFNMPTL